MQRPKRLSIRPLRLRRHCLRSYEREIMNQEEALSLARFPRLSSPADLRKTLATQIAFCLRHYTPGPMQAFGVNSTDRRQEGTPWVPNTTSITR